MNSLKTSPRNRFLRPNRKPRNLVLPSVLSVVAHASLIVLFATTTRSWPRALVGFSDQPTRDVGILFEREGDLGGTHGAGDPNDAPSGTSVESVTANDQFAPAHATTESPPAALLLPKSDAFSQISIGVNVPAGAAVLDPRVTVKSQGGSRAPASGTGGGIGGGTGSGTPGAAFMGARDEGLKVVFVIDASGSMTSHNAMQVAKGALMSSLQALDERQHFLIIFYDDKPQVVKLQNESQPTMAVASDLNKTLARQKISGIQPGSGTDHLPALEMAMRMKPDVMFFLTDALEPPLWPRDLEKIKTLNGGRVRIHSIEFGQGPELEVDTGNFLRKLARQNGGTYRYHDVTRFKSP